jgi:maleylacetate reductase
MSVALVTGGGRGLGAVLAQRLAREGLEVAVAGRDSETLDATVRDLSDLGATAVAVPTDVTDPEAVIRMVDQVTSTLGPIEMLVDNAGISEHGPLWESDADRWWNVVEVNLRGPFLCSRAVLPEMVSRGSGRIVNVSSEVGNEPSTDMTAYAVSKAGVTRLTDSLAAQLEPHGIAVFAITPGFLPTTDMGQAITARHEIPDSLWQSPVLAAELVARISRGELDALSGRFLEAFDDIDQLSRTLMKSSSETSSRCVCAGWARAREAVGGEPSTENQGGCTMNFVHETLGQRVRFGSGMAAELLAAEVEDLEAERVMVIAAPAEQELAARLVAQLPVARNHDEVVMHVPVDVADRARQSAVAAGADLLVSIGGGSTTGLAKAIALTTGLPIVAVPTTYAGSEATNVWGQSDGGKKTTGVDPKVLPRTVIYDAALTVSLPVEMSVASGLNALAHCVDSMWAPRSDPINQALAAEGIQALSQGLPEIVDDPSGLPGRELALYAAYLSAVAFASAGSGLHHKICHYLGGAFNLPHAQTHAVVLPYVLATNAPSAAGAEHRIAAAFGANDALSGLAALRDELDAPRALRDYGFEQGQIRTAAAALVDVVPESNPCTLSSADLEALLEAAWAGDDPCTLRPPTVATTTASGESTDR